MKPFVPAKIGTIRGPWHMPHHISNKWQSAIRPPNGAWIYFFGTSAEDVISKAKDYKKTRIWRYI